MARFALTDRFVHNAKSPEGQSEYFDDTTRGLALRVSKGAKAWCFHYTAGGSRKRLTLAPNTWHLPRHEPLESPDTGN